MSAPTTVTAPATLPGLSRAFRAIAIAEACSWAGLLIGMFFKYVVVFNDIGVRIFGSIHGGLFIAYVVIAILTARRQRWSAGTIVLALAASVPPLFTLWFERWALRTGRLNSTVEAR
ncbi:DUF3817 domain-containing protein [Pseudonocardia acidicola]|uniref:DUF3817 domain-containing protein n=1 Tax=Pseudonocardia acidicola TaxID=2724939 RepID=A0ABX1SLL0_9PSEU|nr:DUF3817 domain-containing protein [Pseudonocardia acidicola]NMI01039.1 DUF3817 domain-containing protein [Pseudonocardia acidicola]